MTNLLGLQYGDPFQDQEVHQEVLLEAPLVVLLNLLQEVHLDLLLTKFQVLMSGQDLQELVGNNLIQAVHQELFLNKNLLCGKD